MTASRETRTASVGLRLLPSVKAAAERAANEDTRSLASFVEKVLTDHLKANGYLSGGPTATLAGEATLAEARKRS